MKNKQLRVFFDDKGNLLEHCYSYSTRTCKSEPAVDFQDKLEYDYMSSGGTQAARVYFKSMLSGRQYSMFVKDFDAVIKANRFNDKQISGIFSFVKKSNAQAIKLILTP